MHEHNTPQELGRTERITRDASWEIAFQTQLTRDMLASVATFAKKRASWIEAKTNRKDGYLWRELFQDAVTDTWMGDVVWDPMKAPLELHLKRTVRSRSATLMEHLARFPRVPVDAPKVELEREMSEAMEANRASERSVDLSSYVDGVVGTLFMLAADDVEVVRILDCFADNVLERRNIMRAAGMTATAYHNARRRLLALVERLPQSLRDEAIRAMA